MAAVAEAAAGELAPAARALGSSSIVLLELLA